MKGFDNPGKQGILKRFIEPEVLICPKCNGVVKNYKVLGRGICRKCGKVISGSGYIRW